MTRTLAALCLITAFLVTQTGTAAAPAVKDLENHVGVLELYTNIDSCAAGPQAVETYRENTIVVYGRATGVLFYVR